MTATTKALTVPDDTAIDPDSPVDTILVTSLRDSIVNLDQRAGGNSYPAGRSLQNHNHDGVNSALVEIGPNAIRNGSFEQGEDGWTIADYSGGSHTINTTQEMDGAQCLAMTSTSTANGGGEAVSNEFRSCTGGELIHLKAAIKASVANVSSRIRVIWFNDAKAQISTSTFYSSTSTPTALLIQGGIVSAPAAARWYKLELVGGVPGSGSATGTIYFDGITAGPAQRDAFASASVTTSSGTSQSITGIPSGVNQLILAGSGVQTGGGSSDVYLQLGDSGGLETTGYSSDAAGLSVGIGLAVAASTPLVNFFLVGLRQPGTNTWDFSGWRQVNGAASVIAGARKTLSAELDRIGVLGSGGFISGSVSVSWRA